MRLLLKLAPYSAGLHSNEMSGSVHDMQTSRRVFICNITQEIHSTNRNNEDEINIRSRIRHNIRFWKYVIGKKRKPSRMLGFFYFLVGQISRDSDCRTTFFQWFLFEPLAQTWPKNGFVTKVCFMNESDSLVNHPMKKLEKPQQPEGTTATFALAGT